METAKILIVEDHFPTAERMKRILEKKGYKITAIATSRVEALMAIEKEKADLVLMDIHLNGKIEGVITAKEIKQQYPVSIIYVTELKDEEIFKQAKETFPKHYISKPYTDADLVHAVELAIQQPGGFFTQIEPKVRDGIFILSNNGEKLHKKVRFDNILFIKASGPGSD